MQKPFFSIIVVSLNPGERLKKTLESIVSQTYSDYEVILKDGGSTDGSLSQIKKQGFFEKYPKIRVIEEKDKSIYDGMNQAVTYVGGSYIQFLNCGDYFYDNFVLEQVAKEICMFQETIDNKEHETPVIYYGNQYNQLQNTVVYSAPQINDFTCYRNVPCHQVCFYDARLFRKRAYDLKYKVRADYEHFLHSIYEEKAMGVALSIIVASYEGGGFSETRENRKKSALEHREITEKYLGKNKVFQYRMIMLLSLAPVRTWMAENPTLSGFYNGLKSAIYRMKKK